MTTDPTTIALSLNGAQASLLQEIESEGPHYRFGNASVTTCSLRDMGLITIYHPRNTTAVATTTALGRDVIIQLQFIIEDGFPDGEGW